MFEWLLLHTAVAALLACAVWITIGVFRPAPAVRHGLWLVVLLKLLVPPVLVWPLDLLSWESSRAPPPAPIPHARTAPEVAALDPIGPPWTQSVDPVPDSPVDSATWNSMLVSEPWLSCAALAIWIAGGSVVFGRYAMTLARLRRLMAHADTASLELTEAVRQAATAQGIRPPRVLVAPGLASPVVWGLRRTWLLWPTGLENSLSPEGLRAVLAHETAHLRRRDHWVGWLLLMGGCVWWWHPLFRVVCRRLAVEAERACDAQAAGTTPQARRAYAEALVEIVQRMARPARTVPAVGAASDRGDVERRIVMILKGTNTATATRRWLLTAGLLAVMALPTWTLGQPQPRATAPVDDPLPKPVASVPKVEAKGEATRAEPSRDEKVRELEDKLRSVMKELFELRSTTPLPPLPGAMTDPPPIVPPPVASTNPEPPIAPAVPRMGVQYMPRVYYEPVLSQRGAATPPKIQPAAGQEAIHLSRITYKLPAEKAKAMATLLGEVKATVMETKIDGDKLIVTSTPEAQIVVAQLVQLLLANPSGAASSPVLPVPPPPSHPANFSPFTPPTATPIEVNPPLPSNPPLPGVGAPRAPEPAAPPVVPPQPGTTDPFQTPLQGPPPVVPVGPLPPPTGPTAP